MFYPKTEHIKSLLVVQLRGSILLNTYVKKLGYHTPKIIFISYQHL
ncbi:hypothetical protein VCRA2126O85_360023 [Vibrio crassostreae]|nr:hypothetical protein VCRA2128O100_370023 [Vibrio crassostreae]CAK2892466.1 hypothetical protein VCRA2125O83_350036 [Vibrio crassostreae]CAK2895340.1 hypothetical protein VCRA2126O85_360023 [Vibrio crassostreae]CAK2898770.1 hypothetical protein VCRA2127O91_370022 [Vibrio crassostreae]CAK3234095.1 hypothetical protein VCRA2126O88_150095 [Vibrio crassostreae]